MCLKGMFMEAEMEGRAGGWTEEQTDRQGYFWKTTLVSGQDTEDETALLSTSSKMLRRKNWVNVKFKRTGEIPQS